MATVTKIEDLQIWQMAREQCKEIYKITGYTNFAKDTRFVQQIRSASGSVMDNIAEGFARTGNKEFLQFLSTAKGSCAEVQSQLYRAFDANFISDKEFKTLYDFNTKLSCMIYNLMTSLKKSDYKGNKYAQNTEQP